jgi:two-component system, chemotaxis family, protein-glutamate methylesterase/glutaminase
MKSSGFSEGNGRMQNRDIIVIGSSMGGIEALSSLARGLPRDLPAAVFIVQHVADTGPALLAQILGRHGLLNAATAEDGMTPERGRIYVAPPNHHLLLGENGMRVGIGPRENRSRPAIDPLFRTAAVNFGGRVIGVVLTGLLHDGAAGLAAVKRCGGTPIVQDPDDAEFPDMPRKALAAVQEAQRVPLAELGGVLGRLAAEAAPPSPPVPDLLGIEARLTERAMNGAYWDELPGEPTNFTCPECSGAIREIADNGVRRYRCRVGHAYSPHELLSDKGRALETSIWVAMQTLDERAQMLERMGGDERDRGSAHAAARFEEQARETREHAGRLRELLGSLSQ